MIASDPPLSGCGREEEAGGTSGGLTLDTGAGSVGGTATGGAASPKYSEWVWVSRCSMSARVMPNRSANRAVRSLCDS
jgi:hypothetical protein